MVPRRSVLAIVFAFGLALAPWSSVPAEPVPVASGGDDVFRYPLRPGESLMDVARIFRVPVEELIALNHITDANHLSIGQNIDVPNAFARDAAAIRGERDRLLEEKKQMERDSTKRELTVSALQERVRQLEAEVASLGAEVAANGYWQTSAKALGILLLVTLGWSVKARVDRANAMRKMTAIATENAALTAAKDRYREAAGQLELRYQKLYRGSPQASHEVADGTARLTRAFRNGSAEIERLLTALEAEREREEQRSETQRKAFAWLQSLRELLSRDRLKYHTP